MATALTKRLTSEPVSKVEVHISCDKLLNKDVTSKSDPCCALSMMTNGRWMEIGRTENVQNCLSPQFSRAFELDYYFEEVQKLRFAVYDIDNKTPDLSDDDFLGQIECTLGEVVSGSPFTRQLMLKGTTKAGNGTITLRALEISGTNDILHLVFSAKGLDNKDFLGKSDPYLQFNRQMPDGKLQVVHRTEVIKNDLNPKWRPFDVKASRLCGGDFTLPIKIECYDYDSDGDHDLIGSFSTTVEELMKAAGKPMQWSCINQKKATKKKYQNSGIVHLESCKVIKNHSFLDYVFGGLQINFTVGIDFTASNGNPTQPNSLHYMNPHQPNAYMKAIHAVGSVVQDYDSDQLFPALGYGAKIPPAMEVSHCFALNFNASNPFCAGNACLQVVFVSLVLAKPWQSLQHQRRRMEHQMSDATVSDCRDAEQTTHAVARRGTDTIRVQGILSAYQMCLGNIALHGPTNFAPIIYHAAQFAAAAKQETAPKNYFVLLIITDGVISDMADTKRAIVYASTLPFSIIIVGVGSADFSAMDALDCDTGLLRDRDGHVAQRDIVQFVPFRNFDSGPPEALAKQVLAEVPDQVCRYYQLNNIAPGVRPAASSTTATVAGPVGGATVPQAHGVYPQVSQ